MFSEKRDTAAPNGCLSALQEVTQRVLEAVGGIAGSSLEQTSWLSRSLEVKVQPQICEEADEADEADVDGDHDGNFTSSHLKSKSHLHLLHSSVTQSLMLIRSCYFICVFRPHGALVQHLDHHQLFLFLYLSF